MTLKGSNQKRKTPSSRLLARKKIKTQHTSTDNLPWKTVNRPFEAGTGGDDGILELEEVDGVQVVYEEAHGGKLLKFNVLDTHRSSSPDAEEESQSGLENQVEEIEEEEDVPEEEIFDSANLLPNWHSFSLHSQLLRSLHDRGFLSPTPIQKEAVPHALAGRDVVGIAQTGSGKTLAYGIPILHSLLSRAKWSRKTKRELGALILAPTRELALQVSSHLNTCLNSINGSKDAGDTNEKDKNTATKKQMNTPKAPPLVSVAAIVGGMSAQKQQRVIERGVDVLIATPGRLWDIIEENDDLARQIKNIKFLVLDEADRMIEAGHFAELENILRLTLRDSTEDMIPDEPEVDQEEEDEKPDISKDEMQTLIFSATLSKDLQRNVKKRSRPKPTTKRRNANLPASTLDDLLLRLDFRDPDPQIIDLSPKDGVVSTLKESKIASLAAEKDVFLYYFLLRYPGRSLVFLASIDGIRRLMPLMELLNINAFPLHSQLEQRQRLKNLDRFKNIKNSVLLATDIAARGLDIPAVDHVIHYQVPRSADAYVHRNGRTARASMSGFSLLMVSPEEKKMVRAFLGTLGRQDNDISDMQIDLNLLDKLKARVQLARKIDQTQHKIKKDNHERNWMRETAEAMEIELDSDYVSDSDEEKPSKQKQKARSAKTAGLKAELKALLAQPLVTRGVSTRYITSGGRLNIDNLISGDYNAAMLGTETTAAGEDIVRGNKKQRKPKKEQEEEWEGIISE